MADDAGAAVLRSMVVVFEVLRVRLALAAAADAAALAADAAATKPLLLDAWLPGSLLANSNDEALIPARASGTEIQHG
jgi:hypothetical protein